MALNITVKQREAVQVQALQNTRTLRLRGTYTLNITENSTLNTILNILPVSYTHLTLPTNREV